MLPWYAYALMTMLAFGVTNFILKYVSARGMESIFAVGLLWLAVGVMGLIYVLYAYTTGSLRENLERLGDTRLVILPIVAGISLSLGMYTIKRAVAAGPAGPVVAIAAANAIMVAALSWALLGESLSPAKVLGMILVMAGIVIMALF